MPKSFLDCVQMTSFRDDYATRLEYLESCSIPALTRTLQSKSPYIVAALKM